MAASQIRSTRRKATGYGKPRRLRMLNGTITIQGPGVRGLEQRADGLHEQPSTKSRTRIA